MKNLFTLGQFAEIRTGYSFKGKVPSSPNGEIKVLQPKDLKDGRLQNSCAFVGENEVPNWYEQRLAKADILLSNKGVSFRTYIQPSGSEKVIASSSFFVIRTGTKLIPSYLKWYLGQPQAVNFLQQHLTGATVPSLSKRTLVELPIPIPNIAVQKRIEEIATKVEQERLTMLDFIQHRQQTLSSYAWEQIEQYS